MEIKELVPKYKEFVRQLRREFHQYPELSMEEQETTKRIATKLDEMGIPYTIDPEKNTGLVAVIKGNHPGKAVALRADIDALPVTETTGLPFASKHPGKMHACGHDTHISMLLGAARMLLDMKDEIYGTVYLDFQPAEELGIGASYMMRFGDWFDKVGAILAVIFGQISLLVRLVSAMVPSWQQRISSSLKFMVNKPMVLSHKPVSMPSS